MLDEFFAQHPVFHYEELLSSLRQEKRYKETTLKSLLRYHIQEEHIARIRRGYYAVIDGTKNHSLPDSLLIAGRATQHSLIAYHSALVFHGIAYSMLNTVFFISESSCQPFRFQQTTYQPISSPTVLSQGNPEIKSYDRLGLTIHVTTIERTLVDCLDKTKYSGGFEEIWQAAHLIEFIDAERMVNYALLLNNATTIAKLGFFLEQHQAHFEIDEKILSALENKKPKGTHYLSKESQENCYMRRWNLMVPLAIKNRIWEE